MKIIIPRNPDDRIKLGRDIAARTKQDAEQSPLRVVLTPDVEAKIKLASEKSAQAAELRSQSEVLMQERNNMLADVDQFIRSSRDILVGVYPTETKKLTEYGFEVVLASAVAKTPESEK